MSAIPKDAVPRYGAGVRLTHWLVAVLYVLLMLSGFALFHPGLYWLSALFGGGSFMRIVHPFLGVGIFILFFAYAARIWKENRLLPSDRTWLRRSWEVMTKQVELPVEGKYNAGQKVVFWLMLLSIAALLVSGVLVWRPYFADMFGADTRRVASLVHAIFAFVMFVGIGIHVYASYWTKGSIIGMTRGYVSRAWAKAHHPVWYRQVTAHESEKKDQAIP